VWRLAADRSFWDWAIFFLGIAGILGGASVVFLQSRQKSIDTVKQESIDALERRVAQLKEENERLRRELEE